MQTKGCDLRGCAPAGDTGALAATHADAVKVVHCIRKAGGIGTGCNRSSDSVLQLLQVLVVRCELLPQILGKHAKVCAEVQKNLKFFVDEYAGTHVSALVAAHALAFFMSDVKPGHSQQGDEVCLKLFEARGEKGGRHVEQRCE